MQYSDMEPQFIVDKMVCNKTWNYDAVKSPNSSLAYMLELAN